MITVREPINNAPYIHVQERVVMYINHHTIHKGVESPVSQAVILQSRTIPVRTVYGRETKREKEKTIMDLICKLAAQPFFNRLAAAFALDTAIEQTQTDTKREPHNRRNNA